MSKGPILVVLAAGMGSRYGGLKQIDPMGAHGEYILDYSLYDARRAGFERVVFVIKPEIEADFRRLVGGRIAARMDTQYAMQELTNLPEGYTVPEGRVKPWGTAHAALCAAPFIDAPFAVINADDFYGRDAYRVMYDFLAHARDTDKAHYAMVGYRLENTLTENGSVSRGVCTVDEAGYLTRVVEHTHIISTVDGALSSEDMRHYEKLPADTVVSMNMWGFTPSMIVAFARNFRAVLGDVLQTNPLKGEYYLPGAVSTEVESGRADVRVLRSADRWYGVTHPQDKQTVVNALAAMAAEGAYPSPLWT